MCLGTKKVGNHSSIICCFLQVVKGLFKNWVRLFVINKSTLIHSYSASFGWSSRASSCANNSCGDSELKSSNYSFKFGLKTQMHFYAPVKHLLWSNYGFVPHEWNSLSIMTPMKPCVCVCVLAYRHTKWGRRQTAVKRVWATLALTGP